MKLKRKLWVPALGLGLLVVAAPLAPVAAMGELTGPTVIYVHGFNLSTKQLGTLECQFQVECPVYWETQDAREDNRLIVHVGYDGRKDPLKQGSTRGATRLLQILNNFCRRDQGQACRIVNHSMGGMVTGYVVAKFNRTNYYNIEYVSSIVSASGGSELASLGDGILKTITGFNPFVRLLLDKTLVFTDAVRILTVSKARKAYDHNQTNGVPFYHIAGNVKKSRFHPLSWIMKGKHDTALSMHSMCGYRKAATLSKCGGYSKLTGPIWNRKRKYYAPFEGHHVHPLHSKRGVKVKHSEFLSQQKYTVSGL